MPVRSDSVSARDLSDDRLWEQCHFETFRGPGPGGQKRNKTSSAVRVTHRPTGIGAIAGESRSQSRNKSRAFERLRLRLVLELRQGVHCEPFKPPAWLPGLVKHHSLHVGRRAEHYLPLVALVLDLLEVTDASVADTARLLGITTGNLVGFLEKEPQLWAQVNRMRQLAGHKPLSMS